LANVSAILADSNKVVTQALLQDVYLHRNDN